MLRSDTQLRGDDCSRIVWVKDENMSTQVISCLSSIDWSSWIDEEVILDIREGLGRGRDAEISISALICLSLRVDLDEREDLLESDLSVLSRRRRTAKVRMPAIEYFRYFESCIYGEVELRFGSWGWAWGWGRGRPRWLIRKGDGGCWLME